METMNNNDEVRRFVILRVGDGLYYNGNQTFSYNNFSGFEKAKVFKNTAGAKNACLNLEMHQSWYVKQGLEKPADYEIVEIVTKVTDNITKYERKYT